MWYNTNKKYILRGNSMEKKKSEWINISQMLWITDRLPTREDIELNRCDKFIVAKKYNSYPQNAYYSLKYNKWYKNWNSSTNSWEEELEGVMAWQFLPVFDYNKFSKTSDILEEKFKKKDKLN